MNIDYTMDISKKMDSLYVSNFNKKVYYYNNNVNNNNTEFNDILNCYFLGYSLDKICVTYILKNKFIIKNSVGYVFKYYLFFTKRIPINKHDLQKLYEIIYDTVLAVIINKKGNKEFITLIDLILQLEPIKGRKFLNHINKYK